MKIHKILLALSLMMSLVTGAAAAGQPALAEVVFYVA
jgi:hypothetical protein